MRNRRRRSYPSPKRRSSGSPIYDEAIGWCRGKSPWIRLPLLVYAAYLTLRFGTNLQYQPIFDALNLGIHELGHIVFGPLGMFMSIVGGSLTQCLAPVVSGAMFYRQKDFFAIAFCFAWLGMNLFDVAIYVADARLKALMLVSPFGGDPLHDWHYLLNAMGLLSADKFLAFLMRFAAFACMGIFLWAGSLLLWKMHTLPPKDVLPFAD